MRLGVLNTMMPLASSFVLRGGNIPLNVKEGDPLSGEAVTFSWETVRDSAVEMQITLPKTCFIDRAVVTLGKQSAVTEIAVMHNATVLYRHAAETGRTITSSVLELQAGVVADGLSLVFVSDFADLAISSVTLYGAVEDGVDLFPTPAAVTRGDGALPLSRLRTYSFDSPDARRGGEIFAEKLKERFGASLQPSEEDGELSIVTNAAIAENGYRLSVSEKGVCLSASDLRGFVYGAETLFKLVTSDGIPAVEIDDLPRMPFRGVHLFVPSEENMAFARRLVKYLLSPMGYNVVIMEIAGTGMQFSSHPEIWQTVGEVMEKERAGLMPPFPHGSVADGKAPTKESVRDFVAYIRSFGIDVIPEVQSLGHVQFMTYLYPEIAEVSEEQTRRSVDTRMEDALPADLYPHCYCPSNEKSYEILFDLLDEIIEVFEPREYVHMGHDEVYQIGVCPICKDKDPAELFAADVNRIYDYLKARGYRMMIWGDMLQPVTKYKTPRAIHLIPKDIVLLDFIWYFHLDKDIEDNLLGEGFSVIFGNVYSSHFPRYESRIVKDGILGAQTSAWVPTSEKALQQEGKLYDFLVTGQMFWSSDYAHEYTLVYDRMIRSRMPSLREDLRAMRYPSRMPSAAYETILRNPVSSLIGRRESAAPVTECYDSLIFTHTLLYPRARLPWTKQEVPGKYRLTYHDGTTEEIPLRNGGNIGYCGVRPHEPYHHRLYRHNGYAAVYETDTEILARADGTPVTVYRYEHPLPKGKTLTLVELIPEEGAANEIYLYRIEGVRLTAADNATSTSRRIAPCTD